jgi:hypothetical protein
MGYRDDSPYRDNPFINIYSEDGTIDMSNTGIPLLANGNYLPPYSGQHYMGTNVIKEVPAYNLDPGFAVNSGKGTGIAWPTSRINSDTFSAGDYNRMRGLKPGLFAYGGFQPGGIVNISELKPTQDLSKKKRKVINSLKEAIAKGEYIEPIEIKEAKKGYEVVDGHHRLMAYLEMGVKDVPVKQKNKLNTNIQYAQDGVQKESGTYVKVNTPEGVKTLNTDSEEYRKYYSDLYRQVEGDVFEAPNMLPEATVTGVDPMTEKYPYWNNLSAEQKKYINEPGSIGRGVRAQATSGYGINDNPTFAKSASDFAMGSLTAGPVGVGKATQAAQSLMVEGIEHARGNE